MPWRENPVSPDGKWIVFGTDSANAPRWTIVSSDGRTFRFVGSPMPCYLWAEQWLRDSKAFLGVGLSKCQPRNPELFLVPIDGGPPRHIALPPNQGGNDGMGPATGFQLTPDGKHVLIAADGPGIGSIVSIDIAGIVGSGKGGRAAGKP
jgi:hypothetical protein